MNVIIIIQRKAKLLIDNSGGSFFDEIYRRKNYALYFLFIVFFIISCTPRKSTNYEGVNEDSLEEVIRNSIEITPSYRLPIDSNLYIFTFNKAIFQIWEGSELISNVDSIMSGYITFDKEKICLGQDIRSQNFFIDSVDRLSNGDYHFITHYDTVMNVEIAILKSNDNGIVTVKFTNPPIIGIIVHCIDAGFTKELKIYE
jgi:hypothetical protein